MREHGAKLDEQNAILQNQQKILNELQVLCEFTSNDIIKASKQLQKKYQEKTIL